MTWYPLAVVRCGTHDLSFYVGSEVKPDEWYVVELDNPKFKRGRCSCEDFQIRIESFIDRGEIPPRWVCKHCEATILAHYADYDTDVRFTRQRVERAARRAQA